MALVDVVKYEAFDDSLFVWKFPSEELKIGAQLIVNEGQVAVFVKGGQALDVFLPGTHTLTTGNIPLINTLVNLPFGGKTPFSAEVWYVSTTVKRDLKWGTMQAIPLMDTVLGFPVSVRSFGKWGIRIKDARSFLTQIVGSQRLADAGKVKDYFIGEIVQALSSSVGQLIASGYASILQIAALSSQVSQTVGAQLTKEFSLFGVELINFNIESINIPADEMERIQSVFAKTLEARELSKVEIGGGFAQIKSFEVLNSAAQNPGGSALGSMLAAGIGLGAGLPIGQQVGQSLSISQTSTPTSNVNAGLNSGLDLTSKLRQLKQMLQEGLITEEIFAAKRDQLLKDL
jgi:membrane protease subunit (stomatin/prohibitin family)